MDNSQQDKDAKRVEALRRYNILDTAPDPAIDSIVQVAADICQTPVALVSLVDTSRQWFKAKLGVPITQTPREHSFCSHAIEQPNSQMVIEDATKDHRFKDNPMVTGDPNIRFYSGQPLISPDGHALGTLCVIDDKPRTLTTMQAESLSRLAKVVTSLLERQEQSMSSAINLAIEQALQHAITITDPNQADNPMVYTNRAFQLMTGYNNSELIGRNCRFLQGDNTDPRAVDRLRSAVEEQQEKTVTLRNYRKDGSEFWNEITVSPIKDKAGATLYFIGIQKDVSERRSTEAALAQSQAILESAPDAVVISSPSGEIEIANTETVRLFGYSKAELKGLNIDTLIAEQYRVDHRTYRQQFLKQPSVLEPDSFEELYGLTKGGEEVPIDVRLNPVSTDKGTLLLAAIRDVTGKVEAEADLRKSQERYRDLFENSSDLIQSVNPDGSFSYTNPAWLNAFGYSQQEVAELSVLDIVYPSNYDHCQKLFDQVMAGESIPHVEVIFTTKGGQAIYLEGSVSTNVVDGAVMAIRTIFRDVTQRNETAHLLQSAKESAEAAAIAKSRFLAAASHDLRQPLQSASMYVATLARQLDKPDQAKELCDQASKSLGVTARLLDVLLNISKLDSGSITPDQRGVPISEVLNNIVNSSRQQAEQKGLRLHCEYQDQVIHTDPVLLERIIENFVSNAIRYTERGDIRICCDSRGSDIVISVKDTGVGIPLDKQQDIFEEYYQLGNYARDRNKGLGLGLSIVKRLADLLGHQLEVSSVPNKGATFSVSVPLGGAVPGNDPLPSESAVTVKSSPIILLVDDDEYVLKSTKRLLETYDMVVHAAVNGDDALDKIACGLAPDFIISDFRLPRYDGLELVQRVRDVLMFDVPAVIMTGDTSTPRLKQAKLSNFDVLFKPIDLEELLGLISDSYTGDSVSQS